MESEWVSTTEAAGIIGVKTRQAALAIMREAGLYLRRDRRAEVFARRAEVRELASNRRARGLEGRRGRPSRRINSENNSRECLNSLTN